MLSTSEKYCQGKFTRMIFFKRVLTAIEAKADIDILTGCSLKEDIGGAQKQKAQEPANCYIFSTYSLQVLS
jgi:hypothetical protein